MLPLLPHSWFAFSPWQPLPCLHSLPGLLKGLGGSQGEPDDSLMIKGYRVFNKTGDIGIAYADAGLIELPDGRRAVAAFVVKGPFNDPRSTELIRNMAAAMAPVLKPKPAPPRQR